VGILVTVTPPTILAVTLEQAKAMCRICDDDTMDILLLAHIATATAEIEAYTGLILTTRTLRLDMDGFQAQDIDLLAAPVQSVSWVKYDDADGVEQTVNVADYYAVLTGPEPVPQPTRVDV